MPIQHLINATALDKLEPKRQDAGPLSARRRPIGSRLFHALCLFGLASLVACSGGNGGNGGPTGTLPSEAVVVTDAVHLAPGATSATLAWPRSEGPVASYLVFEARNGSGYSFSQTTNTAQANISGQPGDSVQITVVAVSSSGDMSDSSPPSPPMIFHAAVAAATRVQPTFLAASPLSGPNATESPEAGNDIGPEATSESEVAAQDAATQTSDEASSSRLARSLRSLLLSGNARLPERGLSDHANRWLQNQVDSEIAAGVSLAGTGRQDADAMRDLVWQDQAGQLFVSDGKNFLDAEDLPGTFGEAIRLRATERFVGLADFDGDGRGDWLLEDTATGDVWVVDGATGNLIETGPRGETRLAGHGDFDGDGKAEIVWMSDSNRFDFSKPAPAAASLLGASDPNGLGANGPDGFELLAIADLNGDGRDDLLGRGANGGLVMALAREDAGVEWRNGTVSTIQGLDLVATLDVDHDGRAEIAFLNGDVLEIWTAESGLQDSWEL